MPVITSQQKTAQQQNPDARVDGSTCITLKRRLLMSRHILKLELVCELRKSSIQLNIRS